MNTAGINPAITCAYCLLLTAYWNANCQLLTAYWNNARDYQCKLPTAHLILEQCLHLPLPTAYWNANCQLLTAY